MRRAAQKVFLRLALRGEGPALRAAGREGVAGGWALGQEGVGRAGQHYPAA